jgi:succinyl-CoA synthetase beta subunit
MVVLDALAAAGLSATNYCDTSGSPSAAKVATGAGLVAGQTHVDGLLFSTCIANQDLSITAEGLLAGWDSAQWRGPTVVRFAGNQSDRARQMVRDWAALHDVQVVVLGEESDEWHAAAALAGLVTEGARA